MRDEINIEALRLQPFLESPELFLRFLCFRFSSPLDWLLVVEFDMSWDTIQCISKYYCKKTAHILIVTWGLEMEVR